MTTRRRCLYTDDEIRYDPKFRRPCTDDIGEFSGSSNVSPLSIIVAALIAIAAIASCFAAFAQ